MKFYKKHPLLVISILYFAFRLPYITRIPIFNDEAIFLDWGSRILQGTVSPFYSLYDGHPPGLLWLFGIFSKLINDPLVSGRIVAVLAGFITLIGIYKISNRFVSWEISILSSLAYITIPLFMFYDRQALMESSVSAVGVWSLFFSLNYFKKRKLKDVFLLGLVLGIGLYIKASVAIFITTMLILFAIEFINSKNDNDKNDLIVGFFALAGTIFVLYLTLLFQNESSQLVSRSNRYILSFSELIDFPIKNWFLNVKNAIEVSFWHLIPTSIAIGLLGIYKLFKDNKLDKRVFYFFIISLAQLLLLAKLIHSRYIVSFLVLVCIFFAYGLKYLFSKTTKWIVYVFLFIPAVVSSFLLLKPYEHMLYQSYITDTSDLETYYNGFTSGYGINDVREYLEDKSKKTPIFVGVRLDSGNPESAMFAYYGPGKNINIEAIYFDSKIVEIPQEINYINSPKPLYFVSRGENLAGMDKYLKEEKRFYKPNNYDFIGVYSLRKEGE